jgi:D-glycero-D-manno-heptose 1,7-bisphosphate phosphatase
LDRHYLDDPAGLEFAPGATKGLRRIQAMGCRLFIVSNQSGVGRGLISLAQVDSVNRALVHMLELEGVRIEGVYYCPHRPEDRCDCRKPNTGLLLQAAREHSFDPKSAIVIGDKMSDVELGRKVGAQSMLIGAPASNPRLIPAREHLISDLDQAASIIEYALLTADSARSG